MTVDTIPTLETDNAVPQKSANAKILAFVALAFSVAGLLLFWFPILGIAHALVGMILGVMAYKIKARRCALSAIIIGATASIAAIVMTIIEVNSIEVVNTYNASPWI